MPVVINGSGVISGTVSLPADTITATEIAANAVTGSELADDTVTGGKLDISLVAGDTIHATADDTLARLAKGTDGEVLTLASGVPSWAAAGGGGSGAWEYVEKVIPTTAVSILVLQQNMTVGYDYLVTWERIRHTYDTMLTCHLMNGSGTPVQVSSGNLGYSHYAGPGQHDHAVQATDEFHISRVNASGGGSAEDQWWGSMMLINPAAAIETSGWFEGGMRNAQVVYTTSGHWINDTAEAITGLTFGGYGAMTAQGEFISYRRKRS